MEPRMEDRLARLALNLRQQGVVTLGERDLMVEAAQLIRDLRTALDEKET